MQVQGTHTYACLCRYPVTITITDAGGSTATISGTFTLLVTANDDDGNSAQGTTSVTVRPSSTSIVLSGGELVCYETSSTGSVTYMVPPQRTLLPLAEGQIAPATGGLVLTHALDFDQSPGTSVGRDPALVYNSDTVDVRPILPFVLWTKPNGVVPSSITATLTWNATVQTGVTFTPSGHSPGDAYELALQVANPVTATGIYSYSIEVSGNDGSPFDLTFHGQEAVVVRDSTSNPDPFGAGWGLAGLDQLVPIAGGAGACTGLLWVYGDGSSDFFASNGAGGYVTPPDVFGTLVKNGDGSYTFTDPHQNKENFSSGGYLTSVVDPHGLAVTYSYDGSNRLTGVATPDGALTTLSYSGSSLSQVQEPGSRTVTVSAGGLTDAAGNSRSFGYDGNHHLTSDSWSPWNDQFGYDSTTGRLTQVAEGLGTTYTLMPQQLQALKTTPLVSPPNNVATLTDPLNHVTTYSLDDWQGLTKEQTADGAVQQWMRDNAEEVLAYTDANMHVTANTYDGSGDVASQTNADGGTWQYQYDGTFHN